MAGRDSLCQTGDEGSLVSVEMCGLQEMKRG